MDNVVLNPGVGGATIATDDVGGTQHELVKVEFGTDGVATMVSPADPFPVTDSGQQTDALTDAELRATPVPISGTVIVDTSLLLTELQLKADLTETQPVSAASLPLPAGAATAANQQTNALTDTQLRASPVPVSGTVTTTPTDVSALSKEATQLLVKAKTDNLDVALSTLLKPADTLNKVTTVDTITNPVAVTGNFWQGTQPVSGTVGVSNMIAPVETGLAKETTLGTLNTNIAKEYGTWGYVSGSLTGAGNKTGVGRCVGIRVFANGVDSNFNINGGDTIPVRNGAGVDIIPKGNVTNAVVNWVSGSIDVIIESVV